jgi:Arc/MetJ-type ribon-helix-helix transcriptional regulator
MGTTAPNMKVITVNVGRHDLKFIDEYTACADCPFPSRSEFVRAALRAFIDYETTRHEKMKSMITDMPPRVREVKEVLTHAESHSKDRIKQAWHWETVTDEEGVMWNKKVYLEVPQQ